jgi:outer membrane protein TolC
MLRLSMDEAVTMALEANLGLKSERLNVDIATESVASARAAFLPFTTYGIMRNTSSSPAQVFEDGTTAVASASTVSGSGELSQNLPWFGGGYRLQWSGSRNDASGGGTFNPRLGSTVSFNFSQPLWRDFRIDANRAALERSERQHAIVDIQLEQQIVSTQATVRGAYLGLVAAIEGRKVAQQNMDLAEQSLRNSRSRVEVGQAPPIDIITAEASVESNREQLILADARISTAEDALRAQVLDPARPDYWTVHLQPTDAVQLTPRQVDVDAAIQNALANRLDLKVLERSMAITDLNLDLNRNLTHPSVDFNLGYTASGTGGTQIINGTTSVRPFGTVLNDAFSGAYPSWSMGFNVGYPLGRTTARAAVAQSELQKQQQQLDRRQLELQIVSAVRQAGRDIQTSYQRVQATQAALAASERQLQAEERRFAVGLSDTFTLQQRQLQLASARISELNAVIAYNSALIEFDRVQRIP